MQVMYPAVTLSQVPKYLRVATTEEEFREIWKLRQAEFSKLYPACTHFEDDAHDGYACVLYSQDSSKGIISTGRIVFDGPLGLPADLIIKEEIDKLRNKKIRLAEFSKFVISHDARGLLPRYFFTYYEIAMAYNIDSVVFIIRNKNVKLYVQTIGARILIEDVKYNYGTNYVFSLLEWPIKEVKDIFLKNWSLK